MILIRTLTTELRMARTRHNFSNLQQTSHGKSPSSDKTVLFRQSTLTDIQNLIKPHADGVACSRALLDTDTVQVGLGSGEDVY